jgi:hypothetical protein
MLIPVNKINPTSGKTNLQRKRINLLDTTVSRRRFLQPNDHQPPANVVLR